MASTIILSDNGASSGSAGLKQTAGNDGVLILQTTTSGGTATNALYVDTSQNVGLGVTPSAWISTNKAFQFGYGAVRAFTNSANTYLDNNNYVNSSGTDIYLNNGYAGRYRIADNQHIWYQAASGTAGNSISFTQAMTLDASGNLLVSGTTANSWTSNGSVTIGSGSGTMGYSLNIGAGTGGLYFMSNTSGGGRHSGTVGYSGTSEYMWFETGGTERARIDSSGNLLVGTTNTTFSSGGIRLYANNSIESVRDGNATQANVYLNKPNNNGDILSFNRAGTQVGVVSVTTTATTYGTSSDYRLKENIQPMTAALAKVAQLKPCTYKWKVDGSDGEGFIAHELAEVVPQCVTGAKDAVDENGNPVYQGIDTSFLVATLTAAIQELKAELDTAKEQIAILQGAQQ